MKKNKFPVTNIGSVSLLMIFIVLCMVTFAALALSTASANYRSAKRLSEHTTEYYDACSLAEEKLAAIDRILSDSYQKSSDAQTYYHLVKTSAAEIKDITVSEEASDTLISYQTDINNTQAVSVRLRILYPQTDDGAGRFYEITAWQKIHTKKWKGDNSVNLIKLD